MQNIYAIGIKQTQALTWLNGLIQQQPKSQASI